MKNFCRECGEELNKESEFCKHCGTPQSKSKPQETVPVNKTPMTKKKKVMWGSIIGVIIILISFHLWADSYFSKESTQKRYENAVTKQDTGKITNLILHENGSSISEEEAKAFVELIKKSGKSYLNELTSVTYDGKFLGLYDSYKIEIVDQYAYYDNFVDGLTIEFNGEAIPTFEQNGEYITYGPLAPGIYKTEAKFSGDYGETSTEDSLTLDHSYREETYIDMDIPISMVQFYVENYKEFDLSNAYITLNDEKINLLEGGETKELGPFIIDGSQVINLVVQMPWGEVTSEDISIDESHMSINADLISSKQYKEVVETLKHFGDQYLNAFADKSTEPLSSTTDDFKKDIENRFDNDYYFTGKLVGLQIDKESMTVNNSSKTPEINIYTNYIFEKDEHELTEDPELEESDNPWIVSLSYNEKDKKWLINDIEYTYNWGGDDSLEVIEGSNTLHGPSEETVKAEKEKSFETVIEERIRNYTAASIEAINMRDFYYMESFLTKAGPRKKEAEDYIDYLESKDIYEDFYSAELEKVEQVDDTTWKATYIEEIEIIKPDSSAVKKFRTIINLKLVDGEYYVDQLLKTDEI